MPGLYDDRETIEPWYLADGLAGLNRLIHDRSEAGYDRKETLHEFIILGHWATDSCGNFGPVTFSDAQYKPMAIPPGLPRVLPYAEARRYGIERWTVSHGLDGVPPAHVLCPECKRGWVLDDAHDVTVSREDRIVPLSLGKTIRVREEDWAKDTSGVFRFGPEPSVRNAKFIDLSPHPKYQGDVVNEKGWRYHHPPFNHERLTLDYVAEDGDEAGITVFLFFHKRCFEARKARLEREHFTDIFKRAGMGDVPLSEIPNGYCPCERCAPWYVAKTPFGEVTIGWRKRVISIDWSSTGRDLESLFEGEEVTKDAHYIHAWGADKAVDYLQRIAGAFA